MTYYTALEDGHGYSVVDDTQISGYDSAEGYYDPDDLPGMWEEADYLGGVPDEVRGADWGNDK